MWGTHIFKSLNLLELVHGWRYNVSARLALHQLFSIQILLMSRTEIWTATKPYNFMLHTLSGPQTWQFYLFCPALSNSGIHKACRQVLTGSLQDPGKSKESMSCQDPGKSLRILSGSWQDPVLTGSLQNLYKGSSRILQGSSPRYKVKVWGGHITYPLLLINLIRSIGPHHICVFFECSQQCIDQQYWSPINTVRVHV